MTASLTHCYILRSQGNESLVQINLLFTIRHLHITISCAFYICNQVNLIKRRNRYLLVTKGKWFSNSTSI